MADKARAMAIGALLDSGGIPEETARELSARAHGGFSLNAGVAVDADDRDALRRLLSYCSRPAIAVARLQYLPDRERVRYRPIKGKDGILVWTPLQFLGRLAPIIPPPYLNLVRYAGALGPRSRLRPAVCAAAKAAVPLDRLQSGLSRPVLPPCVDAVVRKVASAALRAWALCLARVFEVYPLLCGCGGEMKPVSAITSDSELTRLLVHLGLPAGFPRSRPARAPPLPWADDSQIDPRVDRWEGIDSPGADGWASS